MNDAGSTTELLQPVDFKERIIKALHLGPLTVVQLVNRVGMTNSTVQRVLNSDPDVFEVKGKRPGKMMGCQWGLVSKDSPTL